MSRLNPGTVLAGIFAVLFAFAAAYVVRSFLVRAPEVAAAQAAVDTTMQVPSASADLLAGRTITIGDIALRSMEIAEVRKKIDAKELPADFMSNPEQIVGRILRDPVKAGDSFAGGQFYAEGTGPTVADKLKPGLRAVTISVTDTGLVSGFASPTTLVDVLFRSEELENFPETTFTLIEGIEVLAVGQASYPGSQSPENDDRGRDPQMVHATLAVTPEQASILRVLEGRGEMSLSLRSPDERSAQAVEADLLAAKGRLSIWAREENLLRQMEELSEKTGTEFKEQGRLEEIAKEIETVQIDIQGLEEELARSKSESRKLTLAEVLGIPDPPPAAQEVQAPPVPRMELYLGGQRSSLSFEPPRGNSASAGSGPPLSATTPASDSSPQSTSGSALDNTTSSVAPAATTQGNSALPAQTRSNSSPKQTPAVRTATAPAAVAASRTTSQPTGSVAKTAVRPADDGRSADVGKALQEIDQRVQEIQTNQERSLAQLATQLEKGLSAKRQAELKSSADADIAAQSQQQADVSRVLQQINQRMLDLQASQEQSLAKISTQVTSPAPVPSVPAAVRSELRESVSRIDKLTQAVESLENRLAEKENTSTAETATPVAAVATPQASVATTQETKTAGPMTSAAQPTLLPEARQTADHGSKTEAASVQAPTTAKDSLTEKSRALVWTPEGKGDGKPPEAGKKKDIEVFLGRKRTSSSTAVQQDQSL